MVEIKEEFRVRFQKALDFYGLKPIDIAKRTGISEATISQYRSGYSKPKEKRLVIIAAALGVNPAWLMGLEVPMSPAAVASAPSSLSQDQECLLQKYEELNDLGKEEALKRVSELTEIQKYTDFEKEEQRLSG